MTSSQIDRIANAVLYEGYLLYPYRPSTKNRQRWTFGGLYPEAFCQAQTGADESFNQTECILRGSRYTRLGDDAFGVQVVQRLARRPRREGVSIVDFGIRGLDLAYTLLDGFGTVILVDAHPRGRQPGTLYVLEPDLTESPGTANGGTLMEGHGMDPARVFELVKSLGGHLPHVILVGCEPAPPHEVDEFTMNMSHAVSLAVEEAASLIESLLDRLAQGKQTE